MANKQRAAPLDPSLERDDGVRASVELSRHRGFGGDKKVFLEIIAAKRKQGNASELNLQEFSKVFGIKDKQLAQDLFRVFDANGSGTVTLDELKQMADLLDKGDPATKVELLFKVFDYDKSGSINKSEIEKQFRQSVAENGFSIEEAKLQLLVDYLMHELDPDNTGGVTKDRLLAAVTHSEDVKKRVQAIRLSLQRQESHRDGLKQMAHNPGEVHIAIETERRRSLDLQRPAEPVRPATPPPISVEANVSSPVLEPIAPRKTSVARVDHAAAVGASALVTTKQMVPTKQPQIGWKMREEARQDAPRSRFERAKRWASDERWTIFWVGLWGLLNIAAIVMGWIVGIVIKPRTFEVLSYGAPIAFMGRYMIFLNAPLLLLFMCRNFWTWLRGSAAAEYFPVDRHIDFHKALAYVVVAASLIHTAGHLYNFYAIANATLREVQWALDNPHYSTVPSYTDLLFKSVPGITGIIQWIALGLIVGTSASKNVRGKSFEGWWLVHHLFIVFYISCLIHGVRRHFAPIPMFWIFWLIPGALYFYERVTREWKRTHPLEVIAVNEQAASVVHLTLRKPKDFNYRPGQYLFLNCPQVATFEWHPFTITSSPLEDTLEVHIRNLGNWTGALHKLVGESLSQGKPPMSELKFIADGGYGAPSEHVEDFEVVMLVGAGIGITPFAAITKDIHLKQKRGQKMNLKHVYLFWLNREQEAFEWFSKQLHDIEAEDEAELFHNTTYITSAYQKHDLRNFFLRMAMDLYYHRHKQDVLTNLRSLTHWGRPQWQKVFRIIRDRHPAVPTIGLFFCGPPVLATELNNLCKEYNHRRHRTFLFRKEHFGL